MEAQTSIALPILLAVELVEGQTLPRATFSRDEAAELAALIATDLHKLVPKIGEARLALVGAMFDQVELLRPGFPVWATLDDLARRVPRGHLENVVAFGSHEEQMPAPVLEPSPDYAEGIMRYLPMSLLTPPELAEELGEYLEVQLIGRGEAGPLTSDWLMRKLNIKLAHVRYLSRNDLMAVACVQYEHVTLAPLWVLLEAALLTPDRDEPTMTVRGLEMTYSHGQVLVQSPSQWLAALHTEAPQRAHDFAGILFELRQYATLLEAHHVPLLLRPTPGQQVEAASGYAVETFAEVESGYDPPALFAHEAPGLGMIAITVAQRSSGGKARVLAHGYPLHPHALGPLLELLADRYTIPAELNALGRVVLDDQGALGAPAVVLH
ncbi:MAG: hypothetical protein ABI114_12780 [Rhodanobacter sp.]